MGYGVLISLFLNAARRANKNVLSSHWKGHQEGLMCNESCNECVMNV